MAGPSATTIRYNGSWCWLRSMAETGARRWACAPARLLRSQHSQRIGLRMARCSMTTRQFPAHYRGGVFIAFHGSWDRAPYPQGGYNIVFQPLKRRSRVWSVRDICRWFCGTCQDSGESPASSQRACDRTRWVALHLGRHHGADIPRDVFGRGSLRGSPDSLPRSLGSAPARSSKPQPNRRKARIPMQASLHRRERPPRWWR